MSIDPSGEWSLWGAIVGGIVGAIVGAVSAAVTGGNLGDVLIGATAGAAAGIVIGVTGDVEAAKKAGRVVGSACNAIGTFITAKKNGAQTGDALLAAGTSFAITYATASLSGAPGVDRVTGAVVDSTIGFGGALINSAVTTVITEKSKQKQQNNVQGVQTPKVSGKGYARTSQSTLTVYC